MQWVRSAMARARAKAGKRRAARILIILMTTKSSMRVKPRLRSCVFIPVFLQR
jgi:hypothetical protein